MKLLYRIYQWCIAAPILLVLTILTAMVTIVGTYLDSEWWSYYPPRLWSRCWCRLLLVRVEVRNRHLINKCTSYVFVANHQGAFDIFSIYGYLGHSFKWMMRKGLSNFPLVGTACQRAGHVMVDTHTPEGLKRTMDDAERVLKKGLSLVVFPEGRRTETGKMGNFKPGAFKLAKEFGVPVVPISIDGSFQVLPRTTFNVTPGKIILTLHSPITTTEQSKDVPSLMARSHDIIQATLNHQQANDEQEVQ